MLSTRLHRVTLLAGALLVASCATPAGDDSGPTTTVGDPAAPAASGGPGASAGALAPDVVIGTSSSAPTVDIEGLPPPGCGPGTLTASGGPTVVPLMRRAAELYLERCDQLRVVVDPTGDDHGFLLACGGLSDLVTSTRVPTVDEQASCRDQGVDLFTVSLAFESVVVVANRSTEPLDCLSFVDLYALFGDRSAGFDDWADAGALAVDLGSSIASYPAGPLVVTGPSPADPLHHRFQAVVMERLADLVPGASIRADLTVVHDPENMAATVASAEGAVGWVDHSQVLAAGTSVRFLALSRLPSEPCVAPSTATIVDGSYPASRPVLLSVALPIDGELDPAVAAVVGFLLDAGYERAVTGSFGRFGYVMLPSDRRAEMLAEWNDR
ncbi:MAG: PstS family phosphate ABC transporter substrate-binding protein [Acidimicrobiales bacterium]